MIASSATLFFKAVGVGLAVAAPVGPMSLLCLRRTLTQGWRSGLATGAGIAVGDGAYAAVAALGLTGAAGLLLAHPRALHAIAGAMLIGLGLKSLLARPERAQAPTAPSAGSAFSVFAGSMLLTLANPPTIVMFAAIFAALAPRSGFQFPGALATVGGVFAGSLAWWCALVTGVRLFRRGVGPRVRLRIERAMGLLLAGFGALELARAA